MNVRNLANRVKLSPTELVNPPTTPARVEEFMWEMETFMPTVGCIFRQNRLALRNTRLLATETMPAGTQVEMLFVRALTTGRVARELLLRLPPTCVVCLSRWSRRQKMLFGHVLWLEGWCRTRETRWQVMVRPERLLQMTRVLLFPLTKHLFTV